MASYTMKFCPWKNGQGWQQHCIADRIAKTAKGLFSELHRLFFLDVGNFLEEDTDISVCVFEGNDKIGEFWMSDYIENGAVIGGVKYSI